MPKSISTHALPAPMAHAPCSTAPAARWQNIQSYLNDPNVPVKRLVVGCGQSPQNVTMGSLSGTPCSRQRNHAQDFTLDISPDAGADCVMDFVMVRGSDIYLHGKSRFDSVEFEYLSRGPKHPFTPQHIESWIKNADALLKSSGQIHFYNWHPPYLAQARAAMEALGYKVSTPEDYQRPGGDSYCSGSKPSLLSRFWYRSSLTATSDKIHQKITANTPAPLAEMQAFESLKKLMMLPASKELSLSATALTPHLIQQLDSLLPLVALLQTPHGGKMLAKITGATTPAELNLILAERFRAHFLQQAQQAQPQYGYALKALLDARLTTFITALPSRDTIVPWQQAISLLSDTLLDNLQGKVQRAHYAKRIARRKWPSPELTQAGSEPSMALPGKLGAQDERQWRQMQHQLNEAVESQQKKIAWQQEEQRIAKWQASQSASQQRIKTEAAQHLARGLIAANQAYAASIHKREQNRQQLAESMAGSRAQRQADYQAERVALAQQQKQMGQRLHAQASLPAISPESPSGKRIEQPATGVLSSSTSTLSLASSDSSFSSASYTDTSGDASLLQQGEKALATQQQHMAEAEKTLEALQALINRWGG
ncbi:hypothetical protein [Candidatus Pantoea multigeneris]|uniref:Uncharacterized protein n=1 Tax=Candidatus Pantoea multigeneris TaxID=2608357 RepID=A0ABX0REA7_9GAMM|nr:hypothetical protein [Pantoea multigeneris]NIF23690.1 hypothetical protein [Pantoea multigeneris]